MDVETRQKIETILYSSSANPESKVYAIANILHAKHLIVPQLWYAILDLKDKHLKEIDFTLLEDCKEDNVCSQ